MIQKVISKKGAIVIEGHVQGLANARSLGREGIPVIVVDINDCIAKYSKYCTAFFRCPYYNTHNFIQFLINLSITLDLHDWILLPSNDHAVHSISKNKSKLERYYRIFTPDFTILKNIYNKTNLCKIATSNQIPIPRTEYSVSNNGETNLNFPLLIKGKEGLSFYKKFGRKIFLIKNKNELSQLTVWIEKKYKLADVFIQELIPPGDNNKTISVTAFCLQGEIKTYWMGVKLREHPLQFGTATFCKSIYNEECLILSKKLLKSLDYTGVCEIEYILDPRDSDYKLIEINARTWLWVGLAEACGINYPLLVYNYLNKNGSQYPDSYRTDLYWMNIWTDSVFSFIALLKGELNFLQYLKSTLFTPKKFAVFTMDDIKPFFAYSKLIISFYKNR